MLVRRQRQRCPPAQNISCRARLPAVDVDEVWTDEGHPSLVLARSAFARVVWRNRCTASGCLVPRLQPLPSEVVVRFQVQ